MNARCAPHRPRNKRCCLWMWESAGAVWSLHDLTEWVCLFVIFVLLPQSEDMQPRRTNDPVNSEFEKSLCFHPYLVALLLCLSIRALVSESGRQRVPAVNCLSPVWIWKRHDELKFLPVTVERKRASGSQSLTTVWFHWDDCVTFWMTYVFCFSCSILCKV